MKSKFYFIPSIVILVAGLFFLFYSAIINNISLLILSIIIFVTGMLMLIHWSTISYSWKCEKCNSVIELSFWENVKGLNIGVNKKLLFCQVCNKKISFKGIRK